MQAPAVNERLRALGDSAQLGVDLVQYPKEIEPAVLYAMGNALVAATPAAAKKLNCQGGHKVTDLDGTLRAVNGSMSGGATRCARARAGCPGLCNTTVETGLTISAPRACAVTAQRGVQELPGPRAAVRRGGGGARARGAAARAPRPRRAAGRARGQGARGPPAARHQLRVA